MKKILYFTITYTCIALFLFLVPSLNINFWLWLAIGIPLLLLPIIATKLLKSGYNISFKRINHCNCFSYTHVDIFSDF